jgi:acyl carrier protein
MNTAFELKTRLREWIAEHSKVASLPEIKDDTNIIEQRILSSIQLMDLILFMECLRGKPVELERIGVGAFMNVNVIYETFFIPGEADVFNG